MEHLADLAAQRASDTSSQANTGRQADTSRQADTGRGAEHRSRPEGTRTLTSPVHLLEQDPMTRAGFLQGGFRSQ